MHVTRRDDVGVVTPQRRRQTTQRPLSTISDRISAVQIHPCVRKAWLDKFGCRRASMHDTRHDDVVVETPQLRRQTTRRPLGTVSDH